MLMLAGKSWKAVGASSIRKADILIFNSDNKYSCTSCGSYVDAVKRWVPRILSLRSADVVQGLLERYPR